MVILENHLVRIRPKKNGEEVVCRCLCPEFTFSARDKDNLRAYGGCNIMDGIYGCLAVQCSECKTVYLLNSSEYQLVFEDPCR